ncbi:MAG: hypothetical protein K0S42_1150 [Microvirga sp.]|nr:hypothetical protein [Microvirga sp.]
MTFSIPEPLKLEHSELHEELAQATKAGGQVGEAAKAVARVLHGHFVDEEAFAMPPLGVLAQMARGEIVADARQVVALTERLKSELPRMLSEHDARGGGAGAHCRGASGKPPGVCALRREAHAPCPDRGGGALSGGDSGWRAPEAHVRNASARGGGLSPDPITGAWGRTCMKPIICESATADRVAVQPLVR